MGNALTFYEKVFRNSIEQPGFHWVDFGKDIDSTIFRQKMVDLKDELTELCRIHLHQELIYQWLARFNHQHTSRFHRDSAAEHSILMLGYEPTQVDSQVYIADYSKLIEKENTSLIDFFGGNEDVNIPFDESSLASYSTELLPFPKNHYRLLVLNNSKSFEDKTYGVFHRGDIPEKIEGEDRVINSVMLNIGEIGTKENYKEKEIVDFVTTNKIDR